MTLVPLLLLQRRSCQCWWTVLYQHSWSLNLGWLEHASPGGSLGVSEGLGTALGFNKGTGIFSEAWAVQQHLLVHAGTPYMPVFRSWWTETAEVRCTHIS